MLIKFFHPYHLVTLSPWPLIGSLVIFNLVFSMADYFNFSNNFMFVTINLMTMVLMMFQWWRDITREASFEGSHTNEVYLGLKMGMILFITSEIFFFVSFFWAFFHSSLSPDIFIGSCWPPKGVNSFNPMGIPLLNTLTLLFSGVSITWTHHSILKNWKDKSKSALLLTFLLGFYFIFMQMIEYSFSSFSICDSVYGTCFFMATGFHGLHVIVGTIFLVTCFFRLMTNQFSLSHHFGFEAAAWYWHFVDVVWLYLYTFIYWWKF
uniref:Cytochrome c oxidase subunit 3 n=1 Tax=Opimothrips tubulatus TaxID=2724111 RepID=A0A9E9ENP7_9NEOP|nr:cytochrome c oxidase subunit III [Opimothrips tubulatus]WAO28721.1 cytochrome c oxidase subunit III [Opimothrips tubulatus]